MPATIPATIPADVSTIPSALPSAIPSAVLPPSVAAFDGPRIEALLDAHHISHRDFAAVCGLSLSHFVHCLYGHNIPGMSAKIRIAYGLRVYGLLDEGSGKAVMPDA